jgi:hypothetical protein
MKTHITKLRLANQQITSHDFESVKDLVRWMGAIQAQDYGMAKWGIGLRTPGATDSLIEAAIDKGDIIRTHVLRPTWHFVHAKDIRWMIALTAPGVLKIAGSNFRRLELDAKVFSKTNRILEKVLGKGDHLTRPELASYIEKAGIRLDNLRMSHILLRAELDMVVCNGSRRGKQFTYSLFDKRVPTAKAIAREEVLARLATTYFSSHGPATLQDFAWWSGLLIKDARAGLECVQRQFQSFSDGSKTYLFKDKTITARKSSLVLLPAFDEYTIAYSDRSAALDAKLSKVAMTINGIFHPLLVIDGKVVGIWKREEKGKTVL